MSLSLDEVRHIAKLARLELADGDVDATQAKLNGIFGLIEEMQAVDTDGVEPMSHPNQEPPDLPLRVRPPEGDGSTWERPCVDPRGVMSRMVESGAHHDGGN